MPAPLKTGDDEAPLVLLGGHVTRAARDRFASLARREGRTVAGYLRYVVEELTGEGASLDPPAGSARKLNLRLRDSAREVLLALSCKRRSTPAATATALLEASLLGTDGPAWSKREAEELRVLYLNLKAIEALSSDPAVLDATRSAMLRVAGNIGRLEAKAR